VAEQSLTKCGTHGWWINVVSKRIWMISMKMVCWNKFERMGEKRTTKQVFKDTVVWKERTGCLKKMLMDMITEYVKSKGTVSEICTHDMTQCKRKCQKNNLNEYESSGVYYRYSLCM
jgi:hypothetical protein